jgi:hypothetical protein
MSIALRANPTGTGGFIQVNGTDAVGIEQDNFAFLKGYSENIFTVTGTTPSLSPLNGTIQVWTLSGNSSPTASSFAAGQSMTLMIDDGTGFTITWPSVTWVGGDAPTLATSGFTVVELWKIGSTLYGALVGVV